MPSAHAVRVATALYNTMLAAVYADLMQNISTADLSDRHSDKAGVRVLAPIFRAYGGRSAFAGAIATVKCFEDNSLVRAALETPGEGRVLVVDGGGSLNCALLGDILAEMASENAWSGVVVHGCVRDTEALAQIDLGVRALASHPLKSVKRGLGERDVRVDFGGAEFKPGDYLYADADGVLVSPVELTMD